MSDDVKGGLTERFDLINGQPHDNGEPCDLTWCLYEAFEMGSATKDIESIKRAARKEARVELIKEADKSSIKIPSQAPSFTKENMAVVFLEDLKSFSAALDLADEVK